MAKGKKPTPREIYWEKRNKEEREKAALLPAGFVNHGNTCFMNSVLQGLVATRRLEDLVRFQSQETLKPAASCRSPLLTNGRGPEDFQRDWVQGMTLGDAFIQILERSWKMRDAKDRSTMSPRELVSRLGAKYDQYLDFRQQDAHEFLLHLLDGMRMDEFDIIKQRQPPPPPKSKSRRHASNGSYAAHPEPIPEVDRLTSFVDMTFGGKLASVLICEACKHVSYTYEDFDDLSLSITHDESKERMRDRLRTFASKFKSSTNRSRDQTARPTSFSQPPSPPLPPTTLDIPEDAQEAPRRRSLEAPSSVDLVPETPKIDILASLAAATGGEAVGEFPMNQARAQLRKINEVGLGKLGRRISVGMALSGRRDKKPSKVDQESRMGIAEGVATDVKDGGVGMEMTAVSAPTSGPPSRQRSPTPMTKTRKEKTKPRKPSERDVQKAAYLHRLLQDPTTTFSNPLAILRGASPMGASISSQWSKLGSIQGIEDCLKMFTAVEVLDRDNMFGCRFCWKIANGQRPERRNSESDADSESSEDDETQTAEDQPLRRPEIVDPIHSFSMPNLPPSEIVIPSSPPPSSSKSTPPVAPFNPPVLEAEATELDTLDLTQGTVSRFTPSLSSVPYSQASNLKPASASPKVENPSLPPTATDPGLRGRPIPTINAISPPPDGTALDIPSKSTAHVGDRKSIQNVHFHGQLGAHAASSRDSLQLPPVHTHRRRDTSREGDGNLSSEDSEYDDTSGVSDVDGSVASVPSSVGPARPSQSAIPRSKQVVYRRALKRYLIACPPPILVVHLKRFQQVSKSPVTLFGNLKKLDEYVSFPEHLDIRPFLAPKKEDYGLGRGELRGKVTEKGKRAEDQPCVYRLYTVVVHIGNMLGGHYIAYTALPTTPEPPLEAHDESNNMYKERASGGPPSGKVEAASAVTERQWCYISDTVVRLASLNEVLKSKAYICMYERLP